MIQYFKDINYEVVSKSGSHTKVSRPGFPTVIITTQVDSNLYNVIWKRFQNSLEKELSNLKAQLVTHPESMTAQSAQRSEWYLADLSNNKFLGQRFASKEDARKMATDIYEWLQEAPHKTPISEAVIAHEGIVSELVPNYDHVRLPTEELAAKMIDPNSSIVQRKRFKNNSVRLLLDNGSSCNFLEGEAIGIYNKFLGYDLFNRHSSPHFKTAEPLVLGQKGGLAFLITTDIEGETVRAIAKKAGAGEALSFQELIHVSTYGCKGLSARHSIPVKDPIIAESSFDIHVFKEHIRQANELLGQSNLPLIRIGESHVERVSQLNKDPVQRTYGIGTGIPSNQLVWCPEEKMIGLLDVGSLSSLSTVIIVI